jgi:endogenous inhibitor of DNA gyrase (YacG/DUF329 family)
MARCRICGKDAKPRAENAAAPFCSPRCKQVDLGAWLDEKYRVPTHEGPDQAEEPERSDKEER